MFHSTLSNAVHGFTWSGAKNATNLISEGSPSICVGVLVGRPLLLEDRDPKAKKKDVDD